MNIQKIESRDNARLKLTRRVRDGKEPGLIFVEGTRLAEEALRSRLAIEFCLVEKRFAEDPRGAVVIETVSQKIPLVLEISEKLFSSISATESPQGVIFVCRRPDTG